jgi:hypothetical protein
MPNTFDFPIISSGPVSNEFIKRNISSFNKAADFVRQLPFGRNENKNERMLN